MTWQNVGRVRRGGERQGVGKRYYRAHPVRRLNAAVAAFAEEGSGNVLNDSRSVPLSAAELWQRLSAIELFTQFTDEQRESFLNAYEHESGMGVRRIAHPK